MTILNDLLVNGNSRFVQNINGTLSGCVVSYGVSSSESSASEKTVEIDNFNLLVGVRITVKFTNSNTATTPTLNVGDSGAHNITLGGTSIGIDIIKGGYIYEFLFDGTNWEIIGGNAFLVYVV